jgi:hypothetical protein
MLNKDKPLTGLSIDGYLAIGVSPFNHTIFQQNNPLQKLVQTALERVF